MIKMSEATSKTLSMTMMMKKKGRRMRAATLGTQKTMLATRRENAVGPLVGWDGEVGGGGCSEGEPCLIVGTLLSLASFDDRLEDDDFDLIEENLGVKVKRGVSAFFTLFPPV